MFAKIDADNSGTITKDELQAFQRKNMGGNLDERFKQMDKNGNGVIDKDEFKGPAELFAKIDADNSGTITKQELQAFQRKNMAGNLDERFKQMDKNGNGVIDKDEFKGPPEMFDKIDTDHSGTITKAELQAFRAKHDAAPQGEAPKPQ